MKQGSTSIHCAVERGDVIQAHAVLQSAVRVLGSSKTFLRNTIPQKRGFDLNSSDVSLAQPCGPPPAEKFGRVTLRPTYHVRNCFEQISADAGYRKKGKRLVILVLRPSMNHSLNRSRHANSSVSKEIRPGCKLFTKYGKECCIRINSTRCRRRHSW